MSYSLRQRPAYGGNYTKGRQGAKIDKLVVHHAATTSFEGIARTFESAGRQASAHYGVGANKNVDQYVSDNDTAWHAGNWQANITSIGIENVNSTGAPDWKIADQTFETLVELCRDLAKKHGLGKLVVGKNLFGHKDFSATACPMQLYGRLHELANAVNKSSGSSKPAGKPSTGGKKSIGNVADEVIAGKWGNGPDREKRLRAAGYDFNAVQNEVNRKLGFTVTVPTPAKKSSSGSIKVGSTVEVTVPKDWNGTLLGVSGQYKVMELNGKRAVIGRGGQVTAAISTSNLRLVGGGSAAPAGNVNERIADQVIRGEWGNGPDREKRLRAAGYDFNAVQKIVNRKLGA